MPMPYLDMAVPNCPGIRESVDAALIDPYGIEPWKSLLLYSLVRCGGLEQIVELGVYRGSTTVWLARALAEHGRGGRVHAVDLQIVPDAHAAVEAAGLSDYVMWHEGTNSWDVATRFEDGTIDMVFVDGDHSFEAVKRDCDAWWQKLKAGGMMAFDDVVRQGGYGGVWDYLTREFHHEGLLWVPAVMHPLRQIEVGLAIAQRGRPAQYMDSP